ncbi:hypothetical protein BDY17DRAFT_303509 [Neohortaea acidophila]|uniref:Uncharacterized protein n=1 Tax=Neohortaea acidophila TaxID=245834 RepID=A0A6A6PJK4_9PEZI|nr:uncharacterized protein BDY17DRAFT_303509 [Neohortaea acidophila]KAF2480248.1 hypothetical protein BDY17DRAFT_303509 [Neohortaea acidophila]
MRQPYTYAVCVRQKRINHPQRSRAKRRARHTCEMGRRHRDESDLQPPKSGEWPGW